MFKIAAEPTFDATLNIVGQGREQQLNLTFRHKTRPEYLDLLDRISTGKIATEDAVIEIVAKWDADMPLKAESVRALQDNQPGSEWAIITGFGEALAVARKGN